MGLFPGCRHERARQGGSRRRRPAAPAPCCAPRTCRPHAASPRSVPTTQPPSQQARCCQPLEQAPTVSLPFESSLTFLFLSLSLPPTLCRCTSRWSCCSSSPPSAPSRTPTCPRSSACQRCARASPGALLPSSHACWPLHQPQAAAPGQGARARRVCDVGIPRRGPEPCQARHIKKSRSFIFTARLLPVVACFLPQATVHHVVKSILSTSFILGFATVVFNLKSRFCKENAWQVRGGGRELARRTLPLWPWLRQATTSAAAANHHRRPWRAREVLGWCRCPHSADGITKSACQEMLSLGGCALRVLLAPQGARGVWGLAAPTLRVGAARRQVHVLGMCVCARGPRRRR